MSTQVNTLGKRYNELRAQGITSKKAAKMINREFKTNVAEGTIRSYGTQYKKIFREVGSHSERNARDIAKQAEKQPTPIPDEVMQATELDERIKTVAREVFQEMLHNLRNERNIITDTEDVPPEPRAVKGEGKGRKENRDYVKASVTVDNVLWDLFTKERDRLKVSTGRLLDAILWRHYGRPPLSYQQEPEAQEGEP